MLLVNRFIQNIYYLSNYKAPHPIRPLPQKFLPEGAPEPQGVAYQRKDNGLSLTLSQ
jgi:hypothetical protein